MSNKTKIKKTLNYFIRLVIIVATYAFIYRQVFYKRDVAGLLEDVSRRSLKEGFWPVIVVVLLLMLINWGLETGKWRLLMSRIEKIPFLKAYRAVMTGVSVSMFTPNRVGEYFGRVFILEKGSHIQGILVTIIGSMSQLLITLLAGLGSLFFFLSIQGFFDNYISGTAYYVITFAIPPLFFLLIFLYFRIPGLTRLLALTWRSRAEKLRDYAIVFSWYGRKDLWSILLLSLVRYLVFSLQFYLMLRLFGVPLPFIDGLLIISLIYLGLTAMPTVALAELGVRGSLSIFLIQLYFMNTTGNDPSFGAQALAASSVIWLINLVIPALLGTFFVYNLKFFRK